MNDKRTDATTALLLDIIHQQREREWYLQIIAGATAGVALLASISALIVAFCK